MVTNNIPPSIFSVCHANVQSLLAGININQHIPSQHSKLDDIYSGLIRDHNFDVISLTETWLTNIHTEDMIELTENYTCHGLRRDRNVGRGGGILTYVKTDTNYMKRADLEGYETEMLWTEITHGRHKILFCTCYRPPGQDAASIDIFMNELQNSIDLALQSNPDVILLTGDFNDRCVYWNETHPTSELKEKLRDLVTNNNFFQMINEPTHFTSNSAYLLDLIITDSPGYVIQCGTLPALGDMSHVPVFCQLNIVKEKRVTKSREVWHYSRGDYIGLNQELLKIDWNTMFDNDVHVDDLTE